MTSEQGYPAAELWPTLNVLDGGGFGDYDLPDSDALVGRTLSLQMSGETLELHFAGPGRLAWRVTDGKRQGAAGREACTVKENGQDLFLVMWASAADRQLAASIVLDLRAGLATIVRSRVVEADGRGRVDEVIEHGALDREPAGELHAPSSDLVGRRVLYVYGPDNAYEHIYLNEHAYTWHCLAGAERGLADTDACTTIRIAPDVYLFCWREKVVPCDGVVLINFAEHRSTGRIFGYDTGEQATNAIAMGARSVLLGETRHDPSLWTR
jgi:MoaF C-terminal domain/MoaF N-terminal domain